MRIHQTLRVTPAMEAKVTNKIWDWNFLLNHKRAIARGVPESCVDSLDWFCFYRRNEAGELRMENNPPRRHSKSRPLGAA